MQKTKLKGGSLSGTYLITPDHGPAFVRKDVSTVHNREYGFDRWYSQLKRMQRYQSMFPGLFPSLITYGLEGDLAYFDMEYIPDAVTGHEFLVQNDSPKAVDTFFAALKLAMARMHSTRLPSTRDPLALYIREEVEQKLSDALKNDRLKAFCKYENIYFNGEKAPAFVNQLARYKEIFTAAYVHTDETYTHGNITLENLLYQPRSGRVIFIDPYEENIIDSVLAEYSQLYQSCNSLYEQYNQSPVTIEGNRVTADLPKSLGLERFNLALTSFIEENYSPKDMMTIRMLEVSQFIRMLPFKAVIDEDKMIFFYCLASNLFHQLTRG